MFQVRDNATVVLSKVSHTLHNYDQNQENHEERTYFSAHFIKKDFINLRVLPQNPCLSFVSWEIFSVSPLSLNMQIKLFYV